jgi:hypothetical protein
MGLGWNPPGFRDWALCSESKGTPMRINIVESKVFPLDALVGKYSHDGSRLMVEKVMHDAVADVAEGLAFWKTIAGKRASQRHASREFLNRNV